MNNNAECNKTMNDQTVSMESIDKRISNNGDKTGRVCNKCGKAFARVNDIYREDFLEINKDWGFFSVKDGKTYRFAICEDCCESLVKSFVVPVEVSDTTELV